MSDSLQPYRSPTSDLEIPANEPSIEYLRAWTYLFEVPNWTNDLLLMSVSVLIPILGPMMIDGFTWERAAVSLGELPGPHEPFEFGKIGRYLQRGAWKLVIALIFVFILQFVMGFLMLAAILGFFAANGGPPRPGQKPPVELILGFYAGFMIFWFILVIAVTFIQTAMVLRAERMADIRGGFDMEFIGDFIGKVWLEMILTNLFLALTSQFVMIAGVLCCIVGILPAAVLVNSTQQFFQFQLYRLYVARGGKPIPITVIEDPSRMTTPVVAAPMQMPPKPPPLEY